MKRTSLFALAFTIAVCSCNQGNTPKETSNKASEFGGYPSNIEWGEHIVTIASCNDCHTPKIMTPQGPKLDSSRLLSGHPADMPDIDVNRQEMESKGLFVSNDLTSWVGPWGISYTANLTSDSTGTGAWSEAQFIYAIRNGKLKGIPNGRPLLPPMPWDMIRNMTDDELKAVFAYLQSTMPIKNVVPPPKPPVRM
jgi:mono/diheme cytochrome c family protein